MKEKTFFESLVPSKNVAFWLILLVMALLGIWLMLGGEERAEKENTATYSFVEEKIKRLCESVGGTGEVTVAVTYEGAVPASALGEASYKISGIGIVCEGGDEPAISQKLLMLVSAACGVPTNRIYIAGT